jgi:hypothetical protein
MPSSPPGAYQIDTSFCGLFIPQYQAFYTKSQHPAFIFDKYHYLAETPATPPERK